ncbi:MAG TPA: glycosyltransferase family 4 protein [Longimicrobiales bacterium]|nr:glycosyltransferase family 4 protein [Longimicrobiales bacterium]
MRPLVLMSGLAPGGAERVTVSFLRRLARDGRPVPLCTLTAAHDGGLAAELEASGVERLDLGATRLVDPAALLRLRRLLRDGGFDLVHAHGQDAAVMAHWARRLARFRLVITRHVLEEPAGSWRERARARAALRALRAADAVVAVSRGTVQGLVTGGVTPRRIEVIPNGIDLERFDPADTAAAGRAIRAAYAHEPGAVVVLVPAVLRAGKGHPVLLEAIPGVRERVPGAVFLLAGGGPLAEEIAVAAKGAGPAVRMLGHREDMPALMAAADAVCLPSRAEALPTVLLEAAAAARPVVASRVGGVPEVVEHGRTGLLVPPGDPAALATALLELLEAPARRRALGEAALIRARESFGLETQVGRTLELWRRVAEEAA